MEFIEVMNIRIEELLSKKDNNTITNDEIKLLEEYSHLTKLHKYYNSSEYRLSKIADEVIANERFFYIDSFDIKMFMELSDKDGIIKDNWEVFSVENFIKFVDSNPNKCVDSQIKIANILKEKLKS